VLSLDDNSFAAARPGAAADNPGVTLADQIRSQGFSCKEPVSAARDANLSKADEQVWVLTCADATYRIRLHPDMAAGVERISR
jgi:hypothetical protein